MELICILNYLHLQAFFFWRNSARIHIFKQRLELADTCPSFNPLCKFVFHCQTKHIYHYTTYSTLTVEPFHIHIGQFGYVIGYVLSTWQMLMSVKERGQDHVVSMPTALIPLARTRAAVSMVTWWAQEGARVCQHLCVWERMYSMCVRLHVGSRVSHMTIQPVVVCP